MTEILIRSTEGGKHWWAKWEGPEPIWAYGTTSTEAVSNLQAHVPFPYQAGAPDADVSTLMTPTLCYAACIVAPFWPIIIATSAVSPEAAAQTLCAHVPVPQPSGASSGDRPPKLEEKPLPPF